MWKIKRSDQQINVCGLGPLGLKASCRVIIWLLCGCLPNSYIIENTSKDHQTDKIYIYVFYLLLLLLLSEQNNRVFYNEGELNF